MFFGGLQGRRGLLFNLWKKIFTAMFRFIFKLGTEILNVVIIY